MYYANKLYVVAVVVSWRWLTVLLVRSHQLFQMVMSLGGVIKPLVILSPLHTLCK